MNIQIEHSFFMCLGNYLRNNELMLHLYEER